jgi:hypothetical protein
MERTQEDQSRGRGAARHAYQRTYKACLSCARTKAKCELDNTKKCRRCSLKGIDCVFSPKKPWARTKDGSTNSSAKDGLNRIRGESDRLSLHRGQSRLSDQNSPQTGSQWYMNSTSGTKSELKPVKFQRKARANLDGFEGSQPDDATHQSGLSPSVLQRMVSTNKDALNILFDTAIQEESSNISQTTDNLQSAVPQLTEAYAIRSWNACRFVRMGWFSAAEAMQLVDL